jgi:hypothetical protein
VATVVQAVVDLHLETMLEVQQHLVRVLQVVTELLAELALVVVVLVLLVKIRPQNQMLVTVALEQTHTHLGLAQLVLE